MSHWRRTRMISFRVSETEFEQLKTRSEAEGARSVSEFARLTLCAQAMASGNGSGDHQNGDASQLAQLRDDLQELSAYVRRVADLIERGRTPLPRSPMLASSGRNGGM